MKSDRNFDDIAHQFSQNIYGTTKGKLREAILWEDMTYILEQYPKDQCLSIIDAGAGQGQLACKLAKLGHKVTLCDLSKKMLAIAKQNAQKEQVELNYYHGAIQQLASEECSQFDIVLCHAVLEWVVEPLSIITSLKKLLKADGVLSLMFYNYHGLLFRTITLGNFGYVQTGLKKRKRKTLSPDYPRVPDEVYAWLKSADFVIERKTGIRVFHDYLVDKEKQKTRFDELLVQEKQFCRQEPYLSLARYIHVIAKKS